MDNELTTPNPTSSPAGRGCPSMPSTSAEVTNTVTHYYRGELGRMTSWRDRIDRTSNWAITVVAALLSVSLSTPTSHHGVLLFGMMLITLLLLIEARRYRFFDVYRSRVRQLERHYFAQILAPQTELNPDWALSVAASLRSPRLLLSYVEAAQRRLQRNYCWMYAILLLAWILKISTPRLQTEGLAQEQPHSWSYITDNAALGPIPGWIVLILVAVFYAFVLYGTLHRGSHDGDFIHGEAHV
ncbi:putative membrane protein [Rhizobium sp. BK347]|uniref:DUF2270 domain-containing protein n=2 Tax=Rhizobium TaxID=379 RepID=A0A329YBL6_RHITR|nr:putative membrane protein [Rhizobium sp. BK252]MBB3400750.1 putative membrane protein [Rhizobium sp. BK289]MBB3413406.1 putative membrane protein [Rhizobium sp. BK284]MBB3481216.1 putative membrane protein [Rhizobium sp. BK347]RAX39332.1 hypothetical protein DQ393_23080 [Rhizobium tropici]